MSQHARTFRYRLDAADRLVWVDSWWLAFARENGAPELDQFTQGGALRLRRKSLPWAVMLLPLRGENLVT